LFVVLKTIFDFSIDCGLRIEIGNFEESLKNFQGYNILLRQLINTQMKNYKFASIFFGTIKLSCFLICILMYCH